MDYNWGESITSLNNVVVTLNKGGVFTARDIAEDLLEEVPIWKWREKVAAAREESNRIPPFARRQLRREVRRTLNDYFQDESWFDIKRISPAGTSEMFYVEEIQVDTPEYDEHEVAVTTSEDDEVARLVDISLNIDDPIFAQMQETLDNHRKSPTVASQIVNALRTGEFHVG